jgi:adenosylmethionine-8-amino-7-oxononanoate aminotransferase
MFVLGALILAFLILHIMNFYWKLKVEQSVGSVIVNGTEMHDAYTLVASLFKASLGYCLIYIAGAIFLGIHLTHGCWSAFLTIGWSGNIWRTLRGLCDDAGAALIFDEVQTGLGRTGRLWAHEWSGVTPDLMTLAKPLAGGLPMGAIVLAGHVADAIQPGDHGSTFGGGPFVASVALAVCERLGSEEILENVRRCDARLRARFGALASAGAIAEARGRGLLWGLELGRPAGPVVDAARERGLLVCTAGAEIVRLLPPLNVSLADLDEGVAILEEVL